MGFLVFLTLIAVVWLAFKARGRGRDRTQIAELQDLVFRLGQRVATLEERAATTARIAPLAALQETPLAGERVRERHAFPPDVGGYRASGEEAPQASQILQPVEEGEGGVARVGAASVPATLRMPPPPPLSMPWRGADAGLLDTALGVVSGKQGAAASAGSTGGTGREAAPQRAISLEERLGANWLNKLGIVILVIGLSLFLAYQMRTMGPLGKAAAGCVLSLAILVGGLFLERRERYRVFGRAAIGGGWALTFFVAYAMYHVEALRVISSQAVDLTLMMLVAVGMVWHSLRYKSQAVTGLAFLLAFVTVGISHVTLFSLAAGALLAAGLAYVAAREFWYELGLAGLVGVYLNHFLWLSRVLPEGGRPGHPFPEFAGSAGLLVFYWLIFRLAYVLRTPRDRREEILAGGTAVLNSVGLMGLLKYQSSHPEWAFRALLALGCAEMLFAFFARGRRRRPAFLVLSSLASVLLLAAIPFRFSGSNWSLLWLFEAEALLLAGVRLRERVFRVLGLLAGFAAAGQLLLEDALPVFDLRQRLPDVGHHLPVSIALLVGATLFWLNAHGAVRRWRELEEHAADRFLLTATSYLALVSAATGLWVLVPGAGTLVAWMVLVSLLGFAADRLGSVDLAAQADLLAGASVLRALAVNLQDAAPWGFVSQRAASVACASGLFYAGMRRRMAARLLREGYVAAAYSWAGSGLLALLLWYELRPISVAVGWGVLGVVLFELGSLGRRSYFKRQGYVLLAASFARIFFANLNVGASAHWVSPRLYTVAPLLLSYLWVYERLQGEEREAREDRIAGQASAWAATIGLALLYFEVSAEWVVVAWAGVVLALMAAGWWMRRAIFVAQAAALLLAAGGRGLMFNLFSNAPMTASFWNPRTATIVAACAPMLASLPFAFRIRDRALAGTEAEPGWKRLMLRRPEQGLFFVPLLLLTVLLAVQMRAGMITVSWSGLGVLIFLFALVVRERSYRLAGLGLLMLGVGKIIVIDVWRAGPADRYMTLIVMGASLLLISFLYSRYRETILRFL